MELQNFYQGETFDAYEFFGAHLQNKGVIFRTYAPNAQRITIVGEFNNWQEQPMMQFYQSGVWECFAENAHPGQMYKFCIYGQNGRQEHCDPYGFGMELRPGACSVIRDLSEYHFSDVQWMAARTRGYQGPMNIYEMHLGSWRKKEEKWFSYDELAEPLIAYLQAHHYNYVEFMPLSEHPFDGSWGYQNTGFFAPTSRYGTAAQLMELIDRLHHAGIGAILDFVPVHFAVDGYGLAMYDGTPLYEYPHKDVGESEWGSCNFIHSRGDIRSFLQSAANYWLKEYHFDGLRMDAVSRLIYWQGDERRGVNGMTVDFLKVMNKGLHQLNPSAFLIAEDSSVYPGVTGEVDRGGLGFDYKWDLGWMHDTLDYLMMPPEARSSMQQKITFSFHYAKNERYVLPLSHDEVVHGKKTIIDKMQGSYEQKFSQARLLYLLMMSHPGKKLNFMGSELAMFREWDEQRELDWDLLEYPAHDSFLHYISELNGIYLDQEAFWQCDYAANGIEWIQSGTDSPCLFAFCRVSERGSRLLCLFNFSDQPAAVSLESSDHYLVILHTDWQEFGGETERTAQPGLPEQLPPFSGLIAM